MHGMLSNIYGCVCDAFCYFVYRFFYIFFFYLWHLHFAIYQENQKRTGMEMMNYKGIMILLNRNRALHCLMGLLTMTPFLHMFLLLFLLYFES